MNSQSPYSSTNWVFSFLDSSNIIKTFPWLCVTSFLLVIKTSQDANTVLCWNMRRFYDSLAHGDPNQVISIDPFQETKKKCLPININHLPMDEWLLVRMTSSFFTCIPLTIEKRDGPSFSDATMTNLIVDNNEKLMQLLFSGSPNSSLPPGQQLMQVTEYRIGSKTIARKFEAYIKK